MRKNRLTAAVVPEPGMFSEGDQADVRVESESEFFSRVREKLGANPGCASRPGSVTLSFESPERLLQVLSPKRYELFKSVRERGAFASIEELATAVHRDRSTVSKDVQELAAVGLIVIETVAHPGHGRKSSITAAARDIRVQFAL